jgi:hypothetical protein
VLIVQIRVRGLTQRSPGKRAKSRSIDGDGLGEFASRIVGIL